MQCYRRRTSVCVLGTLMSHTKTTEPIKMVLGCRLMLAQKNCALHEGPDPPLCRVAFGETCPPTVHWLVQYRETGDSLVHEDQGVCGDTTRRYHFRNNLFEHMVWNLSVFLVTCCLKQEVLLYQATDTFRVDFKSRLLAFRCANNLTPFTSPRSVG